MDNDENLRRTASELFRHMRMLDEIESTNAAEAEVAEPSVQRINRRTSSVSLPLDSVQRTGAHGDNVTLHSRGRSTSTYEIFPNSPNSDVDDMRYSNGSSGSKQHRKADSSPNSSSSPTFPTRGYDNLRSKIYDSEEKSKKRREEKRGWFISRFPSWNYGSCKYGKASSVMKDRFRMLPLLESGRLFSTRDSLGNGYSLRPIGPTSIVLILTVTAFVWTLGSLLTNPLPPIGEVPMRVVDLSLSFNERIEFILREEQRLDASGPFTNIQLPWNSSVVPEVETFADLVRAKDVCANAHDVAMNATLFEKQFGAHEFHSTSNSTATDSNGRKRRVALFTGAYNHIRDGVSLTLNKMVAFLEENGHEVLIFAPTSDTPALESVGKVLSVPSMPIPGRGDYRLSLLLNSYLQKELKKFDPDIVHIATPDLLGFQALLWARFQSKPTACSYHTRFNSYLEYYHVGLLEPASWLVWKEFYGNCDHVYVPSKEIWDELVDHGIKNEIRLWARGVDSDLFNPKFNCEAWRDKIGLKPSDITILLVSRMVWEKNLELFAATIEKLQALGLAFKSIVVGDGPARGEMQERLPETAFLGTLKGEDLSTAYASSDIFLFPSVTETFGSTTLEAMASGLPVVVANSSGSSSLVSDGIDGFVIDPNDGDTFVSSAEKLILSQELREKMGDAGEKTAVEKYKYERIFGDLIHHYESLEAKAERGEMGHLSLLASF
mmetsp:Transcript_13840/g.34873  ORF Transcript_13840/g.34873 Transcript_13840/m.34873 type:complete len:720 (+) Transcript_13840:378-2537(+)